MSEMLAKWQQSLTEMKSYLAKVPADTGQKNPAELPADARAYFEQVASENWENNRKVFIFGQVDLAPMVTVCRQELADWWPLLTGAAAFGDLEATRAAYQVIENYAPNPVHLDSAMTWLSYPHDLVSGYHIAKSSSVLQQFFEWGADPNYDNGRWFEKALAQHEPEKIEIFIEAGGDPAAVFRVLDVMQSANKPEVVARILAAASGHLMVSALDEESLLQVRLLPGAHGGHALKTVFNFQARRVSDIIEPLDGRFPAQIDTRDFADCDQDMLIDLRNTLIELGGTPREITPVLKKVSLTSAGKKMPAVQKPGS